MKERVGGLPLGELCLVTAGGTPSRARQEFWGGDVPWVKISDMLQGVITDTEERLSGLGLDSSAAKLLPRGTVLLSIFATIGRTAVLGIEAATNQAIVGLTIKRPESVEAGYLRRFLDHKALELAGRARGVAQANINGSILKSLVVPLPPLAEQRRIADILDRADAMRAKRRQAIAKAGLLPQSVFASMFGEHAEVLSNWPVAKLGGCLDFLTSGSRGWAEYYSATGDLFLRIQNVRMDELVLDDVAFVRTPATAEARRTRVQSGDVLLSITADLGRTAVVPDGLGPAYINQHLCILRSSSVEPRFLSAYLASPAGQRQVLSRDRNAVKAGLNFDDIKSVSVPLPSRDLQMRFARSIDSIDKVKASHRASLAEMDALFASLQQRAFRGEL